MRRAFRALLLAGSSILVISFTGCEDATSPSAPSETPARAPVSAPSPAPAPAPQPPRAGFGLVSVSLSQSTVESQAQPQGIVSLTGAAPTGGILVTLSSSDTSVVRVPASVIVAAGASSATFLVTTSTVQATTGATITASFGGVARTTTLTVLPPTLTASFTVRSPRKGADSCVLGPPDEVDCDTDGSASRGFVEKWHWTYSTAGSSLSHTTAAGLSKPKISSGCGFLQFARGGDNPDGSRYIQMTIELAVEDGAGSRSSPMRRAVKLYPNRLCGFTY